MIKAIGICLLALGISSSLALAETFPEHNLTLVVPYAAGGSTDVIARSLQTAFAERLNQTVVVENRPGASSNIGSSYVARSGMDGYTMLLQSTMFSLFPKLYANLSYNPAKDFIPIGTVCVSPNIIVVSKNSSLKTREDLLDKGKKGLLSIGSAGTGTPGHLIIEQFSALNGIRVTHVPYQGTAPAIPDLMGGRIDAIAGSLASFRGQLDRGDFRPLFIAATTRSSLAPTIPTAQEAGFGQIDGGIRFLLLVRAGAPADTISFLSKKLREVLAEQKSWVQFLELDVK